MRIKGLWALGVLLIWFGNIRGQVYWTEVITTGDIPARENFGMTYDQEGNRLIVFGGRGENGYLNDIWQFDLDNSTWTVIPANSTELPEARHTPEVFLENNHLWMATGQSAAGLHNDVWSFDFQDSTWTEIFADTIADGIFKPRYGTAGMYDPVTNNLVTFAGFSTTGRVKSTHTFSLDSIVWTNRGLPVRPERRCLHKGVFAEDRREFWIFGGQFQGNRNDTWRMAVDSFVWQEFIPQEMPPARHFHSMVYRGNDEMVVFGGNSSSQGDYSGALNDLWRFNGELVEWDTLPQGNLNPESRVGHNAVYIPETDKMIIFGGRNQSGFLNDAWIYDFDPVNVSVQSVEEVGQSLTIFPNPASDLLNITFYNPPDAFSISIFDVNSRLVQQFHGNVAKFDISSLSPGLYFIKIMEGGNEIVLKLVVQ